MLEVAETDAPRMCFSHAAQLRQSKDPETRMWARRHLNLPG